MFVFLLNEILVLKNWFIDKKYLISKLVINTKSILMANTFFGLFLSTNPNFGAKYSKGK